MEHIVEKNKTAYYQALMEGQKNRYNEKEKIDRWILFFLNSLSELIEKIEIKIKELRALGDYMNERQKVILAYIKQHQPVKIGDIAAGLKEYTPAVLPPDTRYQK